MTLHFDRHAENIGNIVHLEHVNLTVPDQLMATRFYVTALGLTRDPYLNTGVNVMWINAGATQFHLPTPWHGVRVWRTTGLC
jgi:catechol 2,3-dioxygenase-like lactoylglutathione lyase family enzyme